MILRFSERLAIDDDDNIAFGAHLGTGTQRSEAFLRVNTSGVTAIAAVGDPAPGGGKIAGFGEWPSAGPAGRVAFVAAIDDGPGPIESLPGRLAFSPGSCLRARSYRMAAHCRRSPSTRSRQQATTAPFPLRRWAIRSWVPGAASTLWSTVGVGAATLNVINLYSSAAVFPSVMAARRDPDDLTASGVGFTLINVWEMLAVR